MLDVEAAIGAIIRDVKPQVIVTFEPHGAYYHPDHVAIQRATTAAFFSAVSWERCARASVLRHAP
jgi:N-acetyl-1-D-myo-inositol-2-amino-2-deoxy-alpha-D-glucopyranoside deacetylase